MNTISVKLTIADDELYDNFIEPRKVNGELPTLVLRLLTVYATSDELACQIDQFFDQTEDPDACEARSAIMAAIARLNSADACAAQQIESLGGENTSDVDLLTGEDGIILEQGIDEPPSPTRYPNDWTGITSKEPYQARSSDIPSPVFGKTDTDVWQYLNNLTEQITNLTSVVTQVVSAISNQPITVPDTVNTEPVITQGTADAKPSVVEDIQPAADNGQASEKANEGITEAAPNEAVVSEAEPDTDSDEFEVPDFMDAMLAGLT